MRYLTVTEASVLVVSEKHGDRYFLVNSDAELYEWATRILRERIEDGTWYHEEDLVEAGKALHLTEAKPGAAWRFLSNRNQYEYEEISLERLNTMNTTEFQLSR